MKELFWKGAMLNLATGGARRRLRSVCAHTRINMSPRGKSGGSMGMCQVLVDIGMTTTGNCQFFNH